MYRTLAAVTLVALATSAFAHDKGVHALGTVDEITATGIVVRTTDGAKTFKLTPSTRFTKGDSVAHLSDVKHGDRVAVHGDDVNGVAQAAEVRIGQPSSGGKGQ